MRFHHAHPTPHFLLAGGRDDVGYVGATLQRLPADAYGQVFLEIDSPEQALELDAPARMTTTWLARTRRADDAPVPEGDLLARSLRGWLAEWAPDDEGPAPLVVWLGATANPRLAGVHRQMQVRLRGRHHHCGRSVENSAERAERDSPDAGNRP